ncbi:MAG: archaellin/type IV pilin N-terminal domain-containing protein [Candidatus Aenigmatarchaeota archaeon]
MKGISAIIAVVLILLITVALAASAYLFFSTTFSSITQTAGSTISGTVSQFQASFQIESVYNTTTTVNFTIRNTGQTTLNTAGASMGVYLNDQQKSVTYASTNSLSPGAIGSFGITTTPICNAVLKVTLPGVASPQTAILKC